MEYDGSEEEGAGMDGSFYAWQVAREGEGFKGRIVRLPVDALPPGDVDQDRLFVTQLQGCALRNGEPRRDSEVSPYPGIDAAGKVSASTAGPFKPGESVLVTGYDLGMDTDGGYAEYCRVPAGWVVPLPAG